MAKIVVLEDDASTRKLITAVLKTAGHQVTDVDNGAEGLLTVLAELPDLVVSDVEMPKINGFEVLSDMRGMAETANTPVILLTSRTSQEDIRLGMSQGANDYITKPFDPDRLIEAVNKQLALLAQQLGREAKRLGAGFESTLAAGLPELASKPLEPILALTPMEGDAHTDLLPGTPHDLPRQHFSAAWAVSMEVHNDIALREALPGQAWHALLRQLFVPVSKDPALTGADYLDMHESRLTLYFIDQTANGQLGYVRAAQAVQAMLRAGVQCKQWAMAQFAAQKVPALRVLTNLHLGPIDVVRMPLDYGGERDTVVGPTTQLMEHLREGEPRVLWRVLGTAAAVSASQNAYRLGTKMAVSVNGLEVQVHALQDMNPSLSLGEPLESSAWI
ncbi:MAG: response regulator [Burkholderiales bacterium]|nr:MAG: response regulator [Burkholderiales bacterium]